MNNIVLQQVPEVSRFDYVTSTCRSAAHVLYTSLQSIYRRSTSHIQSLFGSEFAIGTCQILKRLPQIASRREKILMAATAVAVGALLKACDITGWVGCAFIGCLSGIAVNKCVNADWKISPFAAKVLAGDNRGAERLLDTMDPAKLNQTDFWIRRAFLRDHTFSKADFLSLPAHLKEKIHQVANVYMDRELLQKVRQCGLSFPYKPGTDEKYPFSPFMDFVEVEECATKLLTDLRYKGQLMSRDEYETIGFKDAVRYPWDDSIQRIIGRNFIQRHIERLGCKHVGVPNMIAVADCPNRQLPFTVGHFTRLLVPGLEVYSQRIKPLGRMATRAELTELLDVVYATEYTDFYDRGNVFLGVNQEGVEAFYFVDTEMASFGGRMPELKAGSLVAPEDKKWFKQEAARRALTISNNPNSIHLPTLYNESIMREHGFFGRHNDKKRHYAVNIDKL